MARYRTKPVVVEAERFFENDKPWPRGVERHVSIHGETLFLVRTGGNMLHDVADGDWVISGGPNGRKVMKAEFFEREYEPDR